MRLRCLKCSRRWAAEAADRRGAHSEAADDGADDGCGDGPAAKRRLVGKPQAGVADAALSGQPQPPAEELHGPLLSTVCCDGVTVLVAVHLEASCLARLSACSRTDRLRFAGGRTVRLCATRRRGELEEGRAREDLQLAEVRNEVDTSIPWLDGFDTEDEAQAEAAEAAAAAAAASAGPAAAGFEAQEDESTWTFERLHLAEHPPRFPQLLFHFASDELVPSSRRRLEGVCAIFQRFPGLRVRIEGFGNPSAPPPLGRAVAQARAAATRQELLRSLRANPGPRAAGRAEALWGEDPDEGVFHMGYDKGRGRANAKFYQPRLVGYRIQAVGRWGADPELLNANSAPAELEDVWDRDFKFRRVGFTVIGLD